MGLSVSVTIMAFNESAVIADQVRSTVAYFEARGVDFEVIVVDDGSTDGTGDEVTKHFGGDSRVKVLRHKRNQGMGVSIRDGYHASSKEFVTQLPGDMQVTAVIFDRFLPLLPAHDLVLSRYQQRDDGLLRKVVSLGFRATTRAMLGYWCDITGTMFIRRALLEDLPMLSNTFMLNCEIPLRLIRAGVRPAFVKIEAQKRVTGASKVLKPGRVLGVLKEILLLREHLS